jgi:hypothetical protein
MSLAVEPPVHCTFQDRHPSIYKLTPM